MKITGAEAHSERLARLAKIKRPVARALYAAGQLIELEAEHSITNGSISGKNHVPSAPGEPPNANTRLLDGRIETELVSDSQDFIKVQVVSYAPYSAYLEFGTSRMAERPFMRPATAKHRAEVHQMVADAVRKAGRGGI